MLSNILTVQNAHPRDEHIAFYEDGHRYTIDTDLESTYTSVTTWNHEHFPKFDADKVISNMMNGRGWKEGHKYWGMTPEQIKEQWDANKNAVSGAGTQLHYDIECFHNNDALPFPYTNEQLLNNYLTNHTVQQQDSKSVEWKYFIQFVRDFSHLIPYRTEWLIYDEEVKIAGSIDMVYKNPDGTLSIYDWKRSKDITRINTFNRFALNPIICQFPDSNFWHYALQLNTYRYILETKYGLNIRDLFLVRLHPDSVENSYELIELPNLREEVRQLFQERKRNLSNR